MKRLLAATEVTAAIFLLLIALLTASNVFVRYVFNFQIPDWFDGASMIQAVTLSWGFALAPSVQTLIQPARPRLGPQTRW